MTTTNPYQAAREGLTNIDEDALYAAIEGDAACTVAQCFEEDWILRDANADAELARGQIETIRKLIALHDLRLTF